MGAILVFTGMITYLEFWTLTTCLLGAVQCFLLAGYFSFLQTGNTKAHRLFALLMLLIGLRLLKSGHYLFIGEAMPQIWMNLGFLAHFAAGPLVFLYMRTHLEAPAGRREMLWHFLPAVVLLCFIPWLNTGNFWYVGGYHFLLFYSLAYFGAAVWWWLRARSGLISQKLPLWAPRLLFGVGVFFIAYFSNYTLRLIPYSYAPVLYSLAVFPISFAAWRNYPELTGPTQAPGKYENLHLSRVQLDSYRNRILQFLEKEKPFLDPEFNLGDLVNATDIPSHQLSMTLNQYMQTNFPKLVNAYRVREACRLLREADFQHYTIAAIAFEAGFNSLSVFNQHFKEQMGVTPSVYRKSRG